MFSELSVYVWMRDRSAGEQPCPLCLPLGEHRPKIVGFPTTPKAVPTFARVSMSNSSSYFRMFVSELCYKTLRSCLAVSLIVLTITSTTTAAAIQQSPTVTHTNPGRGPEARQEQAESKQTTTKAPMEWRPIAVSGVDEAQARVYFGAPAE